MSYKLRAVLFLKNFFENKTFWKSIIKKPLKNQFYFSFRTQSLLKDKVIKNKKSLELMTSRSWGCETSSKISSFSYMLSDQVLWSNVKQFLSYSKNYICKFMQVISWHHKLFHFHLSFWIWRVWKGREKNIKNLNISRTKRAF